MNEFEFSENAYFFKLKEGVDMEKTIKDLFKSVDVNREGDVYKEIKRHPAMSIADMNYSFKAFKRKLMPPCFMKGALLHDKFYDRKFAYLLVVEYNNYVVVVKRYIPTIKVLHDVVNPIEYNVLCNMLVSDTTMFKRFSMSNLDIADYAMRGKIVEAENLKAVFSTIGANNFVLNSMRIDNAGKNYSLAMNLSKVNQYGKKTDFVNLTQWFKLIIDKMEASNKAGVSGYLSIFAVPVDYKKEYVADNLKPKIILISLYKLCEEEWIDKITQNVKNADGTTAEVEKSVDEVCVLFRSAMELNDDGFGNYSASIDDKDGAIEIKVQKSGISFASKWCKGITLHSKDTSEYPDQLLDEYIRDNNLFAVMFDDLRLRYANRQLFSDSKLMGNIDVFLELFEEDDALKCTTSEKGAHSSYHDDMVDFPKNSLFNYIENKYNDSNKILVCDDLGTEWADYILIEEDSVAIFAAKHKKLSFSASDFQEVVGQVQKNIGVFYPLDTQWAQKEKKWKATYNLNKAATKIKRVRTKGKTANDAVTKWQKAEKNLNFKRDVYLVVDFISKAVLSKHLKQLQAGINFPEKKEAIPLLWLISSLYATCQELHTGLHIICQP